MAGHPCGRNRSRHFADLAARADDRRLPCKTNFCLHWLATDLRGNASPHQVDRSKDEVGYEISFTKYFYEYQPPRELKAILADLEALDAEAEQLQAELRA